jgi:hypothetical protein
MNITKSVVTLFQVANLGVVTRRFEADEIIKLCAIVANEEPSLVDIANIANYSQTPYRFDNDAVALWYEIIISVLASHIPPSIVLFSGYTEVCRIFGGGMTMAFTECPDTEFALPCIWSNKADVEREIADEIKCYADEVLAGERDEDDEYEGEVEEVYILADGSVYFPFNGYKGSLDQVTGCNKADINLNRILGFSSLDCMN